MTIHSFFLVLLCSLCWVRWPIGQVYEWKKQTRSHKRKKNDFKGKHECEPCDERLNRPMILKGHCLRSDEAANIWLRVVLISFKSYTCSCILWIIENTNFLNPKWMNVYLNLPNRPTHWLCPKDLGGRRNELLISKHRTRDNKHRNVWRTNKYFLSFSMDI